MFGWILASVFMGLWAPKAALKIVGWVVFAFLIGATAFGAQAKSFFNQFKSATDGAVSMPALAPVRDITAGASLLVIQK